MKGNKLSFFVGLSPSAQLDDEDSILPHKLQGALEHVLDKRKELACDKGDLPYGSCAEVEALFAFHTKLVK